MTMACDGCAMLYICTAVHTSPRHVCARASNASSALSPDQGQMRVSL